MATKEKSKLILVDGSSYLFRAYHALPPLTNSKNIPTGAVYGVINMLRKLVQDQNPDYIAVVFDTKSKNFRHKIYPEYKANRPEMPDDLAVQIQPLHQIIQAMGLPLVAIEGIEADDVIGTLAHEANKNKWEVVISTGDKDMAQLVSPNVKLINTMSGTEMDEQGVIEKFGVKAEQIIDYLALMGDTVDNIPGVPKVGPKTAQKWLTQYETLENIIEHAEEIKGKVGENLRNHLEFMPLAQDLVTIKTDMEINILPSDLRPTEGDTEQLKALFTELEFKSWLKELGKGDSPTKEIKTHYGMVTTEKQLEQWLKKIEKSPLLSVDTETTDLNPHLADLVGVSLSIKEGEACYIPLRHDYEEAPKQLSKAKTLKALQKVLTNKKIAKVGQNIKYDMHVLAGQGLTIEPVTHDTMVASYCYHSTQTRHDMDGLARFYLDHETISYESVAGKGAKQIPFNQVPVEEATPYAAEDADITLRLHHFFQTELSKNTKLQKLYEILEMPLIQVLWQMEHNGVMIDTKMLEKQSKSIEKKLTKLEKQAFELADEEFNLNSPKQLQEILFDKLEMPVLQKTPKGAPSTSESALQELSHDYELPALILDYRSLNKLKTTYTDKLPLLVNPNTHRLHTSYHQAVTATGRLSSSDPNLQNIPIRTEEGRKIREAFVVPKGKKLISADYSQIELRIMAHLSQDPGLLAAFQDNQDIHKFTASEVFSVPLDQVSQEQRRSAKAINFGLIYGMSAYGLARQLDIDPSSAKQYMEAYFDRYPGVKVYMSEIRNLAFEQGYVETLLGRRLYLPEIRSKQVPRRKAAERTAINAPMQGTAADIIKLAMIQIHEKIKDRDDILMLMQVHDELIFEVCDTAVDETLEIIVPLMENSLSLSVPLVVEAGVGDNWQQAH